MTIPPTIPEGLPATPRSLEELSRPLLAALQAATGFDSAYLTTIDAGAGVQRVMHAVNTRELKIPEGVEVPWSDTLCRRALADEVALCLDVPAQWADSERARELGIVSYASEAVRTEDGELIGTLCVASAQPRSWPTGSDSILAIFARLIGAQMEREQALRKVIDAHTLVAASAMTDPLTGVANRRHFDDVLSRLWRRWRHEGGLLRVAYLDCDGFKAINDRHGHAMGDRFLAELARRLAAGVRPGDVVARIGGDEFVIAALCAGTNEPADAEFAARIGALTTGTYCLDGIELDYAGASVGAVHADAGDADAAALLARADAAMYAAKRERKARAADRMAPEPLSSACLDP